VAFIGLQKFFDQTTRQAEYSLNGVLKYWRAAFRSGLIGIATQWRVGRYGRSHVGAGGFTRDALRDARASRLRTPPFSNSSAAARACSVHERGQLSSRFRRIEYFQEGAQVALLGNNKWPATIVLVWGVGIDGPLPDCR